MAISNGNLFAEIPDSPAAEQFVPLLNAPNIRIERIVSRGHASPPGFWYDQPESEWIVVLEGAAAVTIEGEASPRVLRRGDHLNIPAHVRHRVEWTDAEAPTMWLAVHYG